MVAEIADELRQNRVRLVARCFASQSTRSIFERRGVVSDSDLDDTELPALVRADE